MSCSFGLAQTAQLASVTPFVLVKEKKRKKEQQVGDCLQVEEITLNATIVKRSDGGRMWYSNTKLAASNVINVSRSDSKSETVKVCVSNFVITLQTFLHAPVCCCISGQAHRKMLLLSQHTDQHNKTRLVAFLLLAVCVRLVLHVIGLYFTVVTCAPGVVLCDNRYHCHMQ